MAYRYAMGLTKKENLSGWGQYPAAACVSFRPEKRRDMLAALQHPAPVVARGLGRSYGDASLQPEGIILTERLDHFIEFDTELGTLRAQAGVSFRAILETIVPRGWILPVIPGTQFVSLGGAVACNVHGKNHFREGELGEHVQQIRLLLADGQSVECSPQENADLFHATIGGMGMTGIIEEVSLQLKPITSASLKALTHTVDNLEEMIEAFEQHKSSADYMVGWIDHMARGDSLGRGVFESAMHIGVNEGGLKPQQYRAGKNRFNVPFHLPPFVLNRYTMALYNRWRFRRYAVGRKEEIVSIDAFFHPLDAIGNWNRLYGKRGFFQYQCLLPDSPHTLPHLRALLTMLHKKNLFSFLAVLKYHREGKGLLTFSKQGYSLALDFPNTARVRTLIAELDTFVAECGGRVYLAKDALLAPDLFYKMYPAAEEWRHVIHEFDGQARFQSLMSKRLQWK